MVQKNCISNKVLVIVGPTASGKSAFACECAKKFNGVIISADSMQVYKEMSIGTAKPTEKEMQEVEHRLVGTHSLLKQFSAGEFTAIAKSEIKDVLLEGKLPIIVGGTGLFVQSLMYDYDFNQVKSNEDQREKLNALSQELGIKKMYEMLKEKSPERAKQIHPNDKSRIIRALEVLESKTDFAPTFKKNADFDFYVFGTNLPREELYNKINQRVDIMIEDGLLNEIEMLIKQGFMQQLLTSKAIGYKELLPYFNKESSLSDCINLLKQKTRNYAKRQLTWFRAMKEIVWFNPILQKNETLHKIESIVRK